MHLTADIDFHTTYSNRKTETQQHGTARHFVLWQSANLQLSSYLLGEIDFLQFCNIYYYRKTLLFLFLLTFFDFVSHCINPTQQRLVAFLLPTLFSQQRFKTL